MPDDKQSAPAADSAAAQAPDSAAAPGLETAPPSAGLPPLLPAAASARGGEPTPTVGLTSAPPQDLSVKGMFLHADPVVQGVMLLLLLASVATWAIIIEKVMTLSKASRQIWGFKKTAAGEGALKADDFGELVHPLVCAGLKESAEISAGEIRSEYRERVERSMRGELAGLMDRIGYRTLFLATVGSVSPFVGLFGTVWGIMHSFIGIAASGETTLAVVAPGIAEALFATAMGLVAAIPAVVAYNKVTGVLKKITKEALAGISLLGNRLARQRFNGGA